MKNQRLAFKKTKASIAVALCLGSLGAQAQALTLAPATHDPSGTYQLNTTNWTTDSLLAVEIQDVLNCEVVDSIETAITVGGACVVNWSFVNAVPYPNWDEFWGQNGEPWSPKPRSPFKMPLAGVVSVSAVLSQIDGNGNVVGTQQGSYNLTAVPSAPVVPFNQDKSVYKTLVDDATISFAANPKDYLVSSSPEKCMIVTNNFAAEQFARIAQLTGDVVPSICAISFDKIPAGLTLTEECNSTTCPDPLAGNFEDLGQALSQAVTKGLTFKGKFANESDAKFVYRIDRVYWNGQNLVRLPRGSYEKQISVVNGSSIAATIKPSVSSGYAPMTSILTLNYERAEDVANILSVEWQGSRDNGVTWTKLAIGPKYNLSLKDPGSIDVRAVIKSKLSTAVTTTEPFKIAAAQAPLPKMVLKPKLDFTFAPANLSLSLAPETKEDAVLMGGRKYTFEWNIPQGAVATGKGTSMTARMDYPGNYDYSVTITDIYGVSTSYDYAVDIVQMKPFEFSLSAKPGLTFERAPMSYLLRPALKLGHPKDSVISYTLNVDGTQISQGAKLPPVVSGLQAGQHTIKVDFVTRMGVTGSASTTVNVAENQPPVCSLSTYPVPKSRMARVSAFCKDPDGKIKGLSWKIDGEQQTRSASYIMVDMTDRNSADVEVSVTDDSNASTSVNTVVNM